jgi:hypothetical protein
MRQQSRQTTLKSADAEFAGVARSRFWVPTAWAFPVQTVSGNTEDLVSGRPNVDQAQAEDEILSASGDHDTLPARFKGNSGCCSMLELCVHDAWFAIGSSNLYFRKTRYQITWQGQRRA